MSFIHRSSPFIPCCCFQAISLAFCHFLEATSPSSLVVQCPLSLCSLPAWVFSSSFSLLPSSFWLLILAWLKATTRPWQSLENASRAASTQRWHFAYNRWPAATKLGGGGSRVHSAHRGLNAKGQHGCACNSYQLCTVYCAGSWLGELFSRSGARAAHTPSPLWDQQLKATLEFCLVCSVVGFNRVTD